MLLPANINSIMTSSMWKEIKVKVEVGIMGFFLTLTVMPAQDFTEKKFVDIKQMYAGC